MNYKELLKRAREKIPKKKTIRERFEIPKVNSFIQGHKTIVTNLNQVANYLNRDINHILKFLSRELATSGLIKGNRTVFTGKFPNRKINEKIEAYVKEYVLCRECKSPDTKIEKEGRVFYLKCMACQARRPIAAIK